MVSKKERHNLEQPTTCILNESRPMFFINTAMLFASFIMVIIVGWSTYETHKLTDIAEKNLKFSERQIKLSQKPRLSLGFTNEDKFVEHIKETDYYTDTQINYFIEQAKSINVQLFFNIQNFTGNDAYYVFLIRYDTDTGVFYRSNHLFNQIPGGQQEITYFVGPPSDEKGIKTDLTNIYGWDVLEAMKDKGVLNEDAKPHNLILLYLDNENALYVLTRHTFTNIANGTTDLSLPKYYELGSGK